MAKTASNSRNPNAHLHTIVSVATSALFDALSHAADFAIIAKEENEDTSSRILAAIKDMRASATDTGEYMAAQEAVYGNGVRGKANVPGTLRQRLSDNNVDPSTIKWWSGLARGVALYLADPNAVTVDKDGNPLKLRTLYEAYKKAKQPVTVEHREPTNDDGHSMAEAEELSAVAKLAALDRVEQYVAQGFAKFGAAKFMSAMADILAADKSTTLAGKTLAALASKLA